MSYVEDIAYDKLVRDDRKRRGIWRFRTSNELLDRLGFRLDGLPDWGRFTSYNRLLRAMVLAGVADERIRIRPFSEFRIREGISKRTACIVGLGVVGPAVRRYGGWVMAKRRSAPAPVPEPEYDDGMRVEYVPLSEVVLAPRNPKRHDLDVLAESMDRFGYTAPLLPDERTGALVAGHGRVERLRAAKAAGEQPPARVRVRDDGEWLVPVLRGGFESTDDAEAAAYLLVDNKSVEIGGYDPATLSEMVRDLAADGIDRAAKLGWSDAELAALRAFNPVVPTVPAPVLPAVDLGGGGRTADPDHVVFKLGGYTGLVPRAVYESFERRLFEMRATTAEPMLGDVLAAWLRLDDGDG